MMDWTDRHCRYFHRLLTKQTLLYTEMVTTGALMHGSVQRHVEFHAILTHYFHRTLTHPLCEPSGSRCG